MLALVGVAGAWAIARSAATETLAPTATLRVAVRRPGNAFTLGAVGISTEARELSTGHLSTSEGRLVSLMRLLGPSLLRIGGDSVDYAWWTSRDEPPPSWATSTITPADLSALGELLSATGWRVLLGVDFAHYEPQRAAEEARYAKEILGDKLLGVEIGNEPNDYAGEHLRASSYGAGEYAREAQGYQQALAASAPEVGVYGPAVTQNTTWLPQLASLLPAFAGITQHYYASSTCPGAPPRVPPTQAGVLSPAERELEEEHLHELVAVGTQSDRPTLIGETNDSACAGIPEVSQTFASALWALDWALRAASAGVSGLDFHGEVGFCGPDDESPICAAGGAGARVSNVIAQPEFYGMLAARQLEGGRFLPTSVSAPTPLPDLTSWATVAPDGTVKVAIDDLATSGPTQPIAIPLAASAASEEDLCAPSPQAHTGVTLG
ncbi:MAG TPA: hypothetical protein VED41_08095, partial [Solirubrobacteraceae bacterium]|nr:hypothetical protein [Solirubrobacteraceae bacterium]